MNLKENLSPQISCQVCGNCCPNYCLFKKDQLCSHHPLDPKATSHQRGINCDTVPLYIALELGVACSAVLEEVKRLTGIVLETTTDPKNGIKFIANFSKFGPDKYNQEKSEFGKLLKTEIYNH